MVQNDQEYHSIEENIIDQDKAKSSSKMWFKKDAYGGLWAIMGGVFLVALVAVAYFIFFNKEDSRFDIVENQRIFIKDRDLAQKAMLITIEKHGQPLLYLQKRGISEKAGWDQFFDRETPEGMISSKAMYLFLMNVQNAYIVNDHTDAEKKYPIYQLTTPNTHLSGSQKRIIKKKSIEYNPYGALVRIFDKDGQELEAFVIGKKYKELRRRIYMYHVRRVGEKQTYLIALPTVLPNFIQTQN